MALTSMKRESDDEGLAYCPDYKMPNFPYGLNIYLDEDQCEKLGIAKALKAGTEVTITARAIVVSSTESLERDNDDKGNDVSLSLQITDMGVKAGGMVRNAAAELYGSD